jgi:perosamine synthetase
MFYSLPPVGSRIYFRDILRSIRGSLANPHVIEDFKKAIQNYFDVKHCLLINSGRAALTAILMALKEVDERDEVIIPSYTCFSVPAAIIRAGLKIGLCDIELETLDFNYEQLEAIISEKTLAIIPCHLFGLVADVNRVIEIAKAKKVWVIEDAAQAMGARLKGKYVGTIGDVGFFSLGRGKPMTTMGGGIIVTNNDYLYDKIYSQIEGLIQNSKFRIQNLKFIIQSLIYSIFLHPRLYWIPDRLPFLHLGETIYDPNFSIGPFAAIQAQQGLIGLKRLKEYNTFRYQNGIHYSKKLMESNGIVTPKQLDSSSPTYLRYPIYLKNKSQRDKVYQSLKRQGLGGHFMYPSSVCEITGITDHLNDKGNSEMGRQVAEKLLTLPTHTFLIKKDFEEIEKLLS